MADYVRLDGPSDTPAPRRAVALPIFLFLSAVTLVAAALAAQRPPPPAGLLALEQRSRSLPSAAEVLEFCSLVFVRSEESLAKSWWVSNAQ